MTWKEAVDSSVASGRWSNRGGVLVPVFAGFLDVFETGSVSGVEVLSFSALRSGDRLELLEGGFDSFGDVEALCLSFFGTAPFCLGLLCILADTVASDARLSLSILVGTTPSTARCGGGRPRAGLIRG